MYFNALQGFHPTKCPTRLKSGKMKAIHNRPNGGYTPEKMRRALGMFRGLEKLRDGQYLKFKRVIVIQDDKIVYDEPF